MDHRTYVSSILALEWRNNYFFNSTQSPAFLINTREMQMHDVKRKEFVITILLYMFHSWQKLEGGRISSQEFL